MTKDFMEDEIHTPKGEIYTELFFFLSFFKILFIYLRERMRERESMRGGGSEGEADSPLSGEPSVGLDPGTPGS